MKRTLALPAVALLALTACGGADNSGDASTDEDRIAELEAQVEELESDDSTTLGPDAGADPILGDTNSQMEGEVTAEIGESIPVDLGPFVEGNPYAGEVALLGVEFSDTCEVGGSMSTVHEPETDGVFAFLTFNIETADEAEGPIDMSMHEFRWDDYHYSLSTSVSLDCELDLGFQDPIEPGESGQYTAVWEVPTTSAELQWREPSYTVTWAIDGDEGDVESSQPEPEAAPEPPTEDEAPVEQDNTPPAENTQQYTGERPLTEEEMNSMSDIEAHCADLNGQYTIIGNSYYEVMGDPSAEAEVEAELDALSAEMEAAGCYDLHY